MKAAKLFALPRFAAILLCSGMLSLQVWAMNGDSDQPINIEADRLEVDDSKNINSYLGNVLLQQGSLTIKADLIVFHFTDDGNLQWLQIEGQPATFRQLNNDGKPINAAALQMKYYEAQSLLELHGQARLQTELDSIESEFISINTATDALQAGGNPGNDRVKMLIQPKKDRSAR